MKTFQIYFRIYSIQYYTRSEIESGTRKIL